MTLAIENIRAPKARKPKGKVSNALRNAAHAYKEAYKEVYGITPSLRLNVTTGYVYVAGEKQGVKLKRLKEMTTQLKRRA